MRRLRTLAAAVMLLLSALGGQAQQQAQRQQQQRQQQQQMSLHQQQIAPPQQQIAPAASARVFVDTSSTLFTVDERYLSWSFLPSEPDVQLAYGSVPLRKLLGAVGPAYFQWQYGNGVAYNITGGSLSACGNESAPARCPAEGQPASEGKPYRVLQREDWSATLDFVAGLPEAKLSFYVASNYGDSPCPSLPNMSFAQRTTCSNHAQWNSTNARQLMEYTAAHRNGAVFAATSLGTEPRWLTYGYRKSGPDLAKDNREFAKLTQAAFAKHGLKAPINTGPCSNQRQDCDQNIVRLSVRTVL
jgi:hypothetical protein